MITIPRMVEILVSRQPFLQEALEKNIVNYSSLARILKPEIEEQLMKDVTVEAIMMALRRMPKTYPKLNLKKIFASRPDLFVRSNLIEITINNIDFTHERHQQLLKMAKKDKKHFLIITEGVFETTIIMSAQIYDLALQLFDKVTLLSHFKNLSSITIKLTEEVVPTQGVYYYILKVIAWEGINIVEVASTFTEFTLIMNDKDVDRAFSVLTKALRMK